MADADDSIDSPAGISSAQPMRNGDFCCLVEASLAQALWVQRHGDHQIRTRLRCECWYKIVGHQGRNL